MPVKSKKCPPCTGDCYQGRACDADRVQLLDEEPRSGLLLPALLIVALLAVFVIVAFSK